jgi:coenzyme F420 biosynthesis associated uncharacterized protein
VVAGYGVRYVASRAATRAAERGPTRLIDWQQARRFALRVSQWEQAGIPDRAARRAQYTRLVEQSEPLIAEYLGVQLPQPINRVYVVDRREWLEANFNSFEVLFAPVEDLYTRASARPSTLAASLGQINSTLLGSQMGVLLGFLARRVLGQYDLSLLSPDPQVRGSLYFVEPNIARVQTQLGLSDEDFRLWIALHECTHVFEFEAYPWVRPYFNSLLRQFLDQLSNQLETLGVGLPQLLGRLIGSDRRPAAPQFRADRAAHPAASAKPPADRRVIQPYHRHGSEAGAVSAGRGVRQRCRAGPRSRVRQSRLGSPREPADDGRDSRAAALDRANGSVEPRIETKNRGWSVLLQP